tara:strand:- start:19848 stop:21686 length:1839 start_codon:yes stop_codon:yes gene_type:complete
MCGIVGAALNTPVAGVLVAGLKRLEYRGYDSAGAAIMGGAGVTIVKTIGTPEKLNDVRGNAVDKLDGKTGIGHTRWATHGKVSERNAHPHRQGKITLVHNGVVENYDSLKTNLIKNGYEFASDTDSEVIAAYLDSHASDLDTLLNVVKRLSAVLTGTFGIVVMHDDYPNTIIVARSGSPLLIGDVNDGERRGFMVASDVHALHPYTEKFMALQEGEVAVLTPSDVAYYDSKGNVSDVLFKTIPRQDDDEGLKGYDTYMQKEISEQPAVIRRLLSEHFDNNEIRDSSVLYPVSDALRKADLLHIVACGTSYHAGLIAKIHIEKHLNIPVFVDIASEYRHRDIPVKGKIGFICISQSGETADTLAALRKAKGYADFTLALCNVNTSSMVGESDLHFPLLAGVEIGVASTKAFTSQLCALLMMVAASTDDAAVRERLMQELNHAPSFMETMLMQKGLIRQIATPVLKESRQCIYLGRGLLLPIMMEGALKLTELAYIQAQAYPSGELKHGPLALIDKDMPVVAFIPNDENAPLNIANVEEVFARGGKFLLLVDEGVALPAHFHDEMSVIMLPTGLTVARSLTDVLPLQILSYLVTEALGYNIDKPRSLAKSVTVQ